jgi:enediyne biosynthesis protein E4
MSQAASRWRLVLLCTLAAAGLLWGGWKWSQVRHYRLTLARVEDEMDAGLYALAASELTSLLDRNPSSDEVAFLLGMCEKAQGRAQAADRAWARIPATSAFAFRALEGRVQLELEQGRLTAAEQLIKDTCNTRVIPTEDPGILLGPIYCQEGRLREAMQLIEVLWRRNAEAGKAASETSINQLRLYIQIQRAPVPDESIRATLERAGQIAPADERIWLSKANLAIRAKSYQEAAQWIERCLDKQPEEPAVWRARLDWAMATGHTTTAREALKHLPASGWDSREIEKLAAWFAAQNGDDETEKEALKHVTAADPTDVTARDRLIDLLDKAGHTDLATAERRRKDEIARILARYQALFIRNQPRRDAVEMGRLAAQLGRRFEAKAFLTIALARAPDRADIRRDLAQLDQSADTLTGSGGTLDQVLAPKLDDSQVRLRQ